MIIQQKQLPRSKMDVQRFSMTSWKLGCYNNVVKVTPFTPAETNPEYMLNTTFARLHYYCYNGTSLLFLSSLLPVSVETARCCLKRSFSFSDLCYRVDCCTHLWHYSQCSATQKHHVELGCQLLLATGGR